MRLRTEKKLQIMLSKLRIKSNYLSNLFELTRQVRTRDKNLVVGVALHKNGLDPSIDDRQFLNRLLYVSSKGSPFSLLEMRKIEAKKATLLPPSPILYRLMQ